MRRNALRPTLLPECHWQGPAEFFAPELVQHLL